MSEDIVPIGEEKPGKNLFWQTMLVWFLVMVSLRVLHELRPRPWFNLNVSVLTGLILIYVPILILWKRREHMNFVESSFGQFLRSMGWLAALSLVVFPLIALANHFFQQIAFHHHYVGGHYEGLAKALLAQILTIALPEEFFYRGFLQERFNQCWGKPWKLLGAAIGKSLFFTSFLFALSHTLVEFQWWHFSIFFPSMAFGWLKERTGSISAGVFFHAFCNVFSMWVALNYR